MSDEASSPIPTAQEKQSAKLALELQMRRLSAMKSPLRPNSTDGAITRLLKAQATLVHELPHGNKQREALRNAGTFLNANVRHADVEFEQRLVRIVGAEPMLTGFLDDPDTMQAVGVKAYNDTASGKPSPIAAALAQYRETLPAVQGLISNARAYLERFAPEKVTLGSQLTGLGR